MERIRHTHVAVWLLISLTILVLSVNGEPSHVGRSLKAVIARKGPVKRPPVSGGAAKYPLGNDNLVLRPPPQPPSVSKIPGQKPGGNRPYRGKGRQGRKGKRIGRRGQNGKNKRRKGKGLRRNGKGLRRKGQNGNKRKGRNGYLRSGGKKRKGRKRDWLGRRGRGGRGKGKLVRKNKNRLGKKTKKGWRRRGWKNKADKPKRRVKRY